MARVLTRGNMRAALESAAGTYVTPTQEIKLESFVAPEVETDNVDIPYFGAFAGMDDVKVIADWARCNFTVETSLYKSLAYHEIMLTICSLNKSAITAPHAGFRFAPQTSSTKTASFDIVMPDRVFKLKGAKANLQLSGTVGERIMANFEVQGCFHQRVIGSQALTALPPNEAMIIRRLGGITINGNEVNVSEFSFDMGAELQYEKYTNVGEIHMSNYQPTLSLTTRLESGQQDGFDEMMSGETMEFECLIKDDEGNDMWKLVIPRAKLSQQPSFADADGIFNLTREFRAIAQSGDDNFYLEYYTPAN